MLAYRQYLDTLCPSCGFPKDRAHHPDNDGWFEVDEDATVVCWPCTALAKASNDDAPDTEFLSVSYVRDETTHPLPTANLQRRARSRRGGRRR